MKKFKAMERVTSPQELALNIEQLKCFLKVENSIDDNLIITLIKAATEHCESYTGLALISQEWLIQYSNISTYRFDLPIKPVRKVNRLMVTFLHNNKVKYSEQYYTLDQNTILLNVTPIADQIDIICECGYGKSSEDIPANIKSILMEHVAHLYEKRGTGEAFDMKRYDALKELKI